MTINCGELKIEVDATSVLLMLLYGTQINQIANTMCLCSAVRVRSIANLGMRSTIIENRERGESQSRVGAMSFRKFPQKWRSVNYANLVIP